MTEEKSTTVQNTKDMSCLTPCAAVDRRNNRIAAVLLSGNSVAVKAIWATLVAGNNLSFRGGLYANTANPKEDQFLTITGSILENKFKTRLVFLNPALNQEVVLLPLYAYDASRDALYEASDWATADTHNVLIRILNDHTLWPVRPEWKKVLWDEGVKMGLIQELTVVGWPWAHLVSKPGWDTLIDQGVKDGSLWLD